ncbi:IS66 family insertion sequence element accessory protein TnpA [Desulfurispora thermophila]|uniref:IS66 family insertion sequence element accessory protein TnpA n=1 Tax=Desulfurispora thermophila TaxID=265470 RepID=UPI000368B210
MTQAEREKLWEARIAEYRASGQTVREWCANNNIRPHRLWYSLSKVAISLNISSFQPFSIFMASIRSHIIVLVLIYGIRYQQYTRGFMDSRFRALMFSTF